MQIDRLLETVLILMEKKQITAKELSEKFNVATRTIYRDIDTLSLAGIPVYSSKGRGGGIGILKEYTIDRSFLTEKERKDVVFALQGLNTLRYPDIEATLVKISQVFKTASDTNWIEVDFSYWGNGQEEKEKFNVLKEAILVKRLIAFDYYNSYGAKTSRFVEPYKLVYKVKAWYLWGFCREKQDYRVFKVSRIQQLSSQDVFFEHKPPIDFSLDKQDIKMPRLITVRLKFSPEAAYRVYDDFNSSMIECNDDNSVTVTTEYPFDEWVISYILSFGSLVEVLSPDFVKDIVIERAKEILDLYKIHTSHEKSPSSIGGEMR